MKCLYNLRVNGENEKKKEILGVKKSNLIIAINGQNFTNNFFGGSD